jgi:hypothetical protein
VDFQTIYSSLSTIITEWIPVALAVVGAFALIATKTPNKVDNKIAQFLVVAINFLGANFGNAKNKKAVSTPKTEEKPDDTTVEKSN